MSKLLGLLLLVNSQVSVPAIINALIIAGVTASVTSWATVQRVDKRMEEIVHDVREIKMEHTQIRERVVKIETRIDSGKAAPIAH